MRGLNRPYARALIGQDLEQNSATARVLSDALPFIQAHADRTVVIKYGGHAMEDEAASLSFAQDVVMLKQVRRGVVHCTVRGGCCPQ